MKKKRVIKITTIVLACLLLISAISIYAIPKLRITLYVHIYHNSMEKALNAENQAPIGNINVNTWEGTHSMTEYIVMSFGDTYYGYYYSPDDVPLAFQNFDTELTQDGHDYWVWQADGDNHGATSKIIDNWYYFEASF